jgi:CRISPR-associated protein Cmr1
MEEKKKEYKLKAQTDIWTGDADMQKGRTINTGLLGSIRWWFEVLVRGLGGKACDPTKTECKDDKHCVVCELFGCTGWARKFRFEVRDKDKKTKTMQIKKDDVFNLCFTPLRHIESDEGVLLDATIKLIAEYGAMGGKTGYKPSDENGRKDKSHHKDYGLIQLSQPLVMSKNTNDLKKYVSPDNWKQVEHNDFRWSSLQHFWCVNGKYLARQNSNTSAFNRIISRPEAKQQASQNDSWIAGFRPNSGEKIDAESKKVFSFKDAARTYGFVQKPEEINTMKQKLEEVWGKDGWDFIEGNKIIDQLFAGKEMVK